MIYNATLLRVDLPAPNPPGATIAVRCALTPLTNGQARVNELNAWAATLVAYVPLRRVPSPRPVVNGQVLIQPDDADGVLYDVKHLVQRNSPTLEHIQMFLAPAD